jgi:hypothetical protein
MSSAVAETDLTGQTVTGITSLGGSIYFTTQLYVCKITDTEILALVTIPAAVAAPTSTSTSTSTATASSASTAGT